MLVSGKVSEHENFFMRSARRIYTPLLAGSIRNRFGVAVIAAPAGCRLRHRRLPDGG
jgi:cobalt-zinc-cadmium resistance protein CzcA